MSDALCIIVPLVIVAICVFLAIRGQVAKRKQERERQAAIAAELEARRREKREVRKRYAQRLQSIDGITVADAAGTFNVAHQLATESAKENVAGIRALKRSLRVVRREVIADEKQIRAAYRDAIDSVSAPQKPPLRRDRDDKLEPYEAVKSAIDRLVAEADVALAQAQADAAQEAPVRSTQPRGGDIPEQIAKLAELRDAGILTEEEFEEKKTELLSRM